MFKKWKDIENSYRKKLLDKFFTNFDLRDEVFQITEKIHGANFSIIFFPDGHREYAKRSGVLKEENFYNYKEAFKEENNPELYKFLIGVQTIAVDDQQTIQLVGELFGKGVQKRIYYGEGVYWKWFGTYIDGKFLSVYDDHVLFADVNDLYSTHIEVTDIKVPILGHFDSVETADEFIKKLEEQVDIEENSALTPESYNELNTREGVVVRPCTQNYNIQHQYLLVKYKHPKFGENRNKSNKVKKPKKEIPAIIQAITQKIIQYVNENRTQSLFSKYGEIEDMSQMGNYIKYYLGDVYEDFNKDHPNDLKDLKKDEKKYINKQLTNLIVKEIKNNV
jgi:Rnl2 family RNA ligase